MSANEDPRRRPAEPRVGQEYTRHIDEPSNPILSVLGTARLLGVGEEKVEELRLGMDGMEALPMAKLGHRTCRVSREAVIAWLGRVSVARPDLASPMRGFRRD